MNCLLVRWRQAHSPLSFQDILKVIPKWNFQKESVCSFAHLYQFQAFKEHACPIEFQFEISVDIYLLLQSSTNRFFPGIKW